MELSARNGYTRVRNRYPVNVAIPNGKVRESDVVWKVATLFSVCCTTSSV